MAFWPAQKSAWAARRIGGRGGIAKEGVAVGIVNESGGTAGAWFVRFVMPRGGNEEREGA